MNDELKRLIEQQRKLQKLQDDNLDAIDRLISSTKEQVNNNTSKINDDYMRTREEESRKQLDDMMRSNSDLDRALEESRSYNR